MVERRERHIMPRRRHHDVEDDIRLGLFENGVEIGADGYAVERELLRPRLGARHVEIDETRDGHAFGLARGLEPHLAHRAAADEDGLHHPKAPPARVIFSLFAASTGSHASRNVFP